MSNVKLFNYKVVGNFTANVLDIKFTWFRVRTAEISLLHCGPRWGDGNPRNYIKGRTLARGRHLHPRICSHQSHVFAFPMDPISMLEGSHEAMKEGAKGRRSPWCRRRGRSPPRRRPRRRRRPRPRCSSPPSLPLSPSHMQWFILPDTSVPSYVNMVFDAIIFILWSMSCFHSLFVLRLICWISLVH